MNCKRRILAQSMGRRLVAIACAVTCSCQSSANLLEADTIRAKQFELVDAHGAVVAEIRRTNHRTALRFFENRDGVRRTAFEVTSDDQVALEDGESSLSQADREVLRHLGYVATSAGTSLRIYSDGGMHVQLTGDGVNFYGPAGDIVLCVIVDEPEAGQSRVEVYDNEGKRVYSSRPEL